MDVNNLPIEVHQEIDRTRTLYGSFPVDYLRASAILVEEATEVLSEALKMSNPESKASHRKAAGTRRAMVYELIQVIAVAVQMIDNLQQQEDSSAKSAT